MSSYIVLARKWRPAQFSDIVGQDTVVQTLMNAINLDRLHQAYLFTGSRGVGKTSIARIFAKAIRCPDLKKDPKHGFISCNQCPSCKEITSSSSVDVIEIDGASNNGVDAMREIRENVKYLPATGSKKIYIIDEVHMLTTSAFNALLKTLEEPPEHVSFIFATTEPHKIPATILSRCQRFDFRRVSPSHIEQRLEEICQKESINAQTGSLSVIARAADGSMRDALSLLDQVIAFSGNHLTLESVRNGIGLIQSELIFNLLSGILNRKPIQALTEIQKAYEQGHDLKILMRSIIEALHELILIKIGGETIGNSSFSEEEKMQLRSFSKFREIEELELIFQVFHQGMDWIARSPQPNITLNILAIKCATAEILIPITTAVPTIQTQTMANQKENSLPQPQSLISKKNPPSTPKKWTPPKEAEKTLKPTNQLPKTGPDKKEAQQKTTAEPAVEKTWENFIAFINQKRPFLSSLLEHAIDTRLPTQNSNKFYIYFRPQDQYKSEQLKSHTYSQQIRSFADQFFSLSCHLEFLTKESEAQSLAETKQEKRDKLREKAIDAVKNDPIIQEARSLFGGELDHTEVKPKEGSL